MFGDKSKKSAPPIVQKVQEQLADFQQIPQQVPMNTAQSRPFLDAIRKDRISKQAEMYRLEREINKLWELERFADSHETVDALLRYFLDQKTP